MAKQTKRQIVENTRNKVARHYNKEISELKEELAILRRYVHNVEKERNATNIMCKQLSEQVESQHDWIERLLEYMDMSPRERDVHIALARADKENQRRLNDMMDCYTHLFHL